MRSAFDPLLDDVPAELFAHAAGLPFDRPEPSALALLERLTGIRLEQDWLDVPHSRFHVSSPC